MLLQSRHRTVRLMDSPPAIQDSQDSSLHPLSLHSQTSSILEVPAVSQDLGVLDHQSSINLEVDRLPRRNRLLQRTRQCQQLDTVSTKQPRHHLLSTSMLDIHDNRHCPRGVTRHHQVGDYGKNFLACPVTISNSFSSKIWLYCSWFLASVKFVFHNVSLLLASKI